jgi:uncharacterized protein YbjT (DUF2867 family)
MKNVLVLGANGQIAKEAIKLFLEEPNIKLTLFLRQANRLKSLENNSQICIVEGDVLNLNDLEKAMKEQDVVYANLAGDLENHAKNIVKAMVNTGLQRLIFISSMGIYNEIPNERHGSILDPYRNSVKIIESSNLDYTIIRPAWLSNENNINYGSTQKGEMFKNHNAYVSRKSVADLILKLIKNTNSEIRKSLGVHRKK